MHERLLAELKEAREQSKMDVDGLEGATLDQADEDSVTDLIPFFADSGNMKQWRPYFEMLVIYLDKFGGKN